MSRHPDEIRADMQQFYSLDLDGMGTAHTVAHYAACAAMLPATSRAFAAARSTYYAPSQRKRDEIAERLGLTIDKEA